MPRGEEDTRGLHERPPSPLGKCAIERSTFTRFCAEGNVFFSFFRRDRRLLVRLFLLFFFLSFYPLPSACVCGHLLASSQTAASFPFGDRLFPSRTPYFAKTVVSAWKRFLHPRTVLEIAWKFTLCSCILDIPSSFLSSVNSYGR